MTQSASEQKLDADVFAAFWDVLCPGIRVTNADYRHYAPAIEAAVLRAERPGWRDGIARSENKAGLASAIKIAEEIAARFQGSPVNHQAYMAADAIVESLHAAYSNCSDDDGEAALLAAALAKEEAPRSPSSPFDHNKQE